MQFILVCKLNNISFEVAEKEVNKYTKDLKITSYRKIHNGLTEIITYRSEDCKKVFDVNIQFNKKNNSYNLSIYELKEIREIKVTKIDGDYFYTKINGSDEDIINHYNDYNLSCDDKENIQVKFIEYEMEKGKTIFNFEFDNTLNCYQY